MIEIKAVADIIEKMRLIYYLHSDIAMQLLMHHIMCVLLNEVHSFPNFLLILSKDNYIITIYLNLNIEPSTYDSTQDAHKEVGEGLNRI